MQEAEGIGDRKIKAILFDLDNTLFDFVEAKLRACRAVTEYLGLEGGLLDYFLRGKYDIEDPENIRDYLNDRDIRCDDTFEECFELYHGTKMDNVNIYEGVERTLKRLNEEGFTVVVVTDAMEKNARLRIDKLGISGYIHHLITFDTTGKKKPDHEPFLYALKLLDMEPEEIMMVGDSADRDLKPSMEVGFFTVYADYGDRNIDPQYEPVYDAVIRDPEELLGILGLED